MSTKYEKEDFPKVETWRFES